MDFKQFLENDRAKGKSLSELGYPSKYVRIYRAVAATVTQFFNMDYVGIDSRGLKFCKGHAEHQAAVSQEPFHVITALVPVEKVFSASNPDEYFYAGGTTQGKPVANTRVESE